MSTKDDKTGEMGEHAPHVHTSRTGAPEAVDCRRMVDFLGDYVDGDMKADVKAAVDNHLAACAPCVAFLRQYKFAPEAVRRTLMANVPKDLEDRVLSFLRKRCCGSAHAAPKKDTSGS